MNLSFSSKVSKKKVFDDVEDHLRSQGFILTKQDRERPWGGYFVIDEDQARQFINNYFPHLENEELLIRNRLSPKILLIAPEKRLSWQYHHRRAEIWKLISGSAGIITSDTDEENEPVLLNPGDIIQLKQGERHRLIGLSEWGIVAEIWQHTDIYYPSDEDDIVRVQDDFGR